MILKEGIRYDPYEFSYEKINKLTESRDSLLINFIRADKWIHTCGDVEFIVGELCLINLNSLVPVCIESNYTPGLKNYDNGELLINKVYYDQNCFIKEHIDNIIYFLANRGYKFTIIDDLEKYIFEDFKLPEFKTIEDSELWLRKISKKWSRDERRKIKEEELSTVEEDIVETLC